MEKTGVRLSMLCGLLLVGCTSRPEPLGEKPRAAALQLLQVVQQNEDSMLAAIHLNRDKLSRAAIKESLLHYQVPLEILRQKADTKRFDDIPVNTYTVSYTVRDKGNDSIFGSIMVQQHAKDKYWAATRFGNLNMARALDSTRRRLVRATGRNDGFYLVMAPYLFRSYVATGIGNDARMLEVELGYPVWTQKTPLTGQEVFKALRAEADSLNLGCEDTPNDCRPQKDRDNRVGSKE